MNKKWHLWALIAMLDFTLATDALAEGNMIFLGMWLFVMCGAIWNSVSEYHRDQ
jgi:hypothetical protein